MKLISKVAKEERIRENKLQIHIRINLHIILVSIILFTATCFGSNCQPPSDYLQNVYTRNIINHRIVPLSAFIKGL